MATQGLDSAVTHLFVFVPHRSCKGTFATWLNSRLFEFLCPKKSQATGCNKLLIPHVRTPALSLTVFLVTMCMIMNKGSVGGGRYVVDNIDFSFVISCLQDFLLCVYVCVNMCVDVSAPLFSYDCGGRSVFFNCPLSYLFMCIRYVCGMHMCIPACVCSCRWCGLCTCGGLKLTVSILTLAP